MDEIQRHRHKGYFAYPSTTSVRQGETIRFHLMPVIPGPVRPEGKHAAKYIYKIKLVRRGLKIEEIPIPSALQEKTVEHLYEMPSFSHRNPCHWHDDFFEWSVPSDAACGVYCAIITRTILDSEGNEIKMLDLSNNKAMKDFNIVFIVKHASPGTCSRIVLHIPYATYEAYNDWGGQSFYDGPAYVVTFLRPNKPAWDYFERWEEKFIKWADKVGIPLEYCTSLDLHSDQQFLAPYKCLVSAGHDEYWSWGMRRTVESFLSRQPDPGCYASLSGNTCWWQVYFSADRYDDHNYPRLESEEIKRGQPIKTMICYKCKEHGSRAKETEPNPHDPFTRPKPGEPLHTAFATTHWHLLDPNLPDQVRRERLESEMLGVSYRYGAYTGIERHRNPNSPQYEYDYRLDLGPQFGDRKHWVFGGTALMHGGSQSKFGRDYGLIGYETDSVEFVGGERYGTPKIPFTVDGAQRKHFHILASTDYLDWNQEKGRATMVLLRYRDKAENGWVFSASTTDWVEGLIPYVEKGQWTEVCQITYNVLDRFIRGSALCDDEAGWSEPQYYTTIRLADVDGDGRAELVMRDSLGLSVYSFKRGFWQLRGSLNISRPLSDYDQWNKPEYYMTIQLADVDGDGRAELVVRGPTGIQTYYFTKYGDQWLFRNRLQNFLDATGWAAPKHYTTLRIVVDANRIGDDAYRTARLIGRGADGVWTSHFDKITEKWSDPKLTRMFTDAEGWDKEKYYSTIQLADVNGDGRAELVARGSQGIQTYGLNRNDGTWSVAYKHFHFFTDAFGWWQAKYYRTLRLGDVDGDGQAELIGRGADGVYVSHFDKNLNKWSDPGLTRICTDADGWDREDHYSTIRVVDVDGDGRAELVARDKGGVIVYRYNHRTGAFNQNGARLAVFTEDQIWSSSPSFYTTMALADIDGDKRLEIIGRGRFGILTYKVPIPEP